MLSFKEYLLEALDSPYPWKWIKGSTAKKDELIVAQAKTKDGDVLEIMFEDRGIIYGESWLIAFSINNSFKTTNKKDEFKILSTVIDVIKTFEKENPDIEEIYFESSKDEDNFQKRAKAYEKLFQKFFSSKWRITHKETVDLIKFKLVKK